MALQPQSISWTHRDLYPVRLTRQYQTIAKCGACRRSLACPYVLDGVAPLRSGKVTFAKAYLCAACGDAAWRQHGGE